MSIHFVTGVPGAGKGLYTMRLIVQELISSGRNVVTNFPIVNEQLAEYLTKYHDDSKNILNRLVELSDEQLPEFYRYRGYDPLDVEYDDKKRALEFSISDVKDDGVFYVMDEVHLVFGAREWQAMGRAVMYYASQHRKLGDDVILVTQHPQNVDKQFRSLAQDFSELRNHGMEKFLCFKQPSFFSRNTYLTMPTGTNQKPIETATFKLQKEMADCYETARGVGIAQRDGMTADKGRDRRTGFSFWWLIVGIVAVMALVLLIPLGAGSAARSVMKSTEMDENATAKKSPARKRLDEALAREANKTVTQPSVEEMKKLLGSKVRVSGWSTRDGVLRFALTNGQILSSDSGHLQHVAGDHVITNDEKRYDMADGLWFDVRILLD